MCINKQTEWLDTYSVRQIILTQQSAEELALENIDDPVQGQLELVVFLHVARFGLILVLLSLV